MADAQNMVSVFEKDLLEKLSQLEEIIQLPEIFIENYFSELRHQIDSCTEKLLVDANEDSNAKLNNERAKMIDKLNDERQSISNGFSSNHPSLLGSSEKLRDFSNRIASAFLKSASDPSQLEDVYEALALEILNELRNIKKNILLQQSFIFMEEKNCLVDIPGRLVHLKDIYMDDIEIEIVK